MFFIIMDEYVNSETFYVGKRCLFTNPCQHRCSIDGKHWVNLSRFEVEQILVKRSKPSFHIDYNQTITPITEFHFVESNGKIENADRFCVNVTPCYRSMPTQHLCTTDNIYWFVMYTYDIIPIIEKREKLNKKTHYFNKNENKFVERPKSFL